MNLFERLGRILSGGRDSAEANRADDTQSDVEHPARTRSESYADSNRSATEPGDDYDPTVPNLTIIDEASLIQAESEGFDPYDTIAGTSKANLLKDD